MAARRGARVRGRSAPSEQHYAMRTEGSSPAEPGGGSRGLRAGSWELGLGRELTDDSHS